METATVPGISVTGRMRSLEVRWILPGELEPSVAAWFARFPAWVVSREDSYLADPPWAGWRSSFARGARLR
jgi:hypothetical protein